MLKLLKWGMPAVHALTRFNLYYIIVKHPFFFLRMAQQQIVYEEV